MKIKFIPQHDQMDCGPACLAMIANYHGQNYTLQYLRQNSFITRGGVSIAGISYASRQIGLEPFVVQLTLEHLYTDNDLPCIIHWNQNHFVVLYEITSNRFSNKKKFHIADPGFGILSVNEDVFINCWISSDQDGVAIFLKPTAKFFAQRINQRTGLDFNFLKRHLKPYRFQVIQIVFALFATSMINLIFPFLAQAIIDNGISVKNLNIVSILLLAQISLFIGSTIIDLIRNWITLYLGTRINIAIVSEFLIKILNLPISFFDNKLKGDFNQRIQDQSRIESFLTSQSLITIFSLVNFCIFFVVLLYYDFKIVITYCTLTLVAVCWSILFLKRRKRLDYYRFQQRSDSQESIYELVNGIQEIKLNNFEGYKKERWENIQLKLFGINVRLLKTDQMQSMGFDFINQIKNILVTFITAREVILGNITLGAMLGVSYIIGQMNSPLNQLVVFIRSLQDAKLSLERLNEAQSQENEERPNQIFVSDESSLNDKSLSIVNLSYQYGSPSSTFVLKDLNIHIPEGKTTAIVGSSGSGKSTLLKLLLKFYEPSVGQIQVGGEINLRDVSAGSWRKECGVVLQDGYIFADTIRRNIVCGDKNIDQFRLDNAIDVANIGSFINELPLGLNTKIGASGTGISGGQKQRILIARSVYKDPKYLFFDEATSALDAENEKIIHDNLTKFFFGRTVLIIAHRLSTVKNADQIIVMKNGQIIERGMHEQLVSYKGEYFKLIKNQLELGL